MDRFLSNFTHRFDAKGRISIPASFRQVLAKDGFAGVYAYPSLDVRGHIDSIQRGSGSRFTAFPPENATGNFVKVVQRLPVRIRFKQGEDQEKRLRPGMSVEPKVFL